MTEWHASDYHQQSSLQQAMAEEQLGQLTLEGNERILDVGCGDGKITAQIAARVPRGKAWKIQSRKSLSASTGRVDSQPFKCPLRISCLRSIVLWLNRPAFASFACTWWIKPGISKRVRRSSLSVGPPLSSGLSVC